MQHCVSHTFVQFKWKLSRQKTVTQPVCLQSSGDPFEMFNTFFGGGGMGGLGGGGGQQKFKVNMGGGGMGGGGMGGGGIEDLLMGGVCTLPCNTQACAKHASGIMMCFSTTVPTLHMAPCNFLPSIGRSCKLAHTCKHYHASDSRCHAAS